MRRVTSRVAIAMCDVRCAMFHFNVWTVHQNAVERTTFFSCFDVDEIPQVRLPGGAYSKNVVIFLSLIFAICFLPPVSDSPLINTLNVYANRCDVVYYW